MDLSQHASDHFWRTDPHMRAVPGVDGSGPIDHMHQMAQTILGTDDGIPSPPPTEPPPRADTAPVVHAEGLELSELLRQQGILDLPPPDVCEEFFRAFVRYIYPNMPCLDVSSLHDLHQQSVDTVHRPLLLWATLLASCPYVTGDAVRSIGYRSRHDAQESMLKKAKFVYKTGVETDPVARIQSFLLISLWQGEPESPCHWLGLAASLADQHGLNRPSAPLTPGAALRRRLWACIYIRDMQLALLHHHPSQIHEASAAIASTDDFLHGLQSPNSPSSVSSTLQTGLAEVFVHRVRFYLEVRGSVHRRYRSAWTVNSAGDPCSIHVPKSETRLRSTSPAGEALDNWILALPRDVTGMEEEPSALTLLHQTSLKIEYLMARCALDGSLDKAHGTQPLFSQSTVEVMTTIISMLRTLHSENLSGFIYASCMPALVLAATVCSTRLTSGGPEDGAEEGSAGGHS
ncbi:hypothetical protein BJY00DRAFT_310658 [Aspergillus carlsbadensis]|nr:hypothetical protein BJY00DRAFT_310658 [Aspergillus carlsbadensis]